MFWGTEKAWFAKHLHKKRGAFSWYSESANSMYCMSSLMSVESNERKKAPNLFLIATRFMSPTRMIRRVKQLAATNNLNEKLNTNGVKYILHTGNMLYNYSLGCCCWTNCCLMCAQRTIMEHVNIGSVLKHYHSFIYSECENVICFVLCVRVA